jgi:hypothetical protein
MYSEAIANDAKSIANDAKSIANDGKLLVNMLLSIELKTS